MALQPLPGSKALVDLVYERLVAAIADGMLRPGQRLRQDEVAALLGVSRQPVSHAFQLLKRQGLAIEHARKGLAVAPIEPARVRDLYRVRGALDGLAARLAAERAAAGVLDGRARAEAEAALEAGLALLANGAAATAGRLIHADAAFHTALYRLAANPAIEEVVAPQWPHFMRSMGAVLLDPAHRPRVWREHADILGRVLAGEADEAARLARDHAERAGHEAAACIEAQQAAA